MPPGRRSPRGLSRTSGRGFAQAKAGRQRDRTAPWSSVTHVAIGELTDADVVLAHEIRALPARIVRSPIHVGDAVGGPQIRRRVAVTVEAELHGERHAAVH